MTNLHFHHHVRHWVSNAEILDIKLHEDDLVLVKDSRWQIKGLAKITLKLEDGSHDVYDQSV